MPLPFMAQFHCLMTLPLWLKIAYDAVVYGLKQYVTAFGTYGIFLTFNQINISKDVTILIVYNFVEI